MRCFLAATIQPIVARPWLRHQALAPAWIVATHPLVEPIGLQRPRARALTCLRQHAPDDAAARASRPTGSADGTAKTIAPGALQPLLAHAEQAEGHDLDDVEHEREDDRRPKHREHDRERQRLHEDAEGS